MDEKEKLEITKLRLEIENLQQAKVINIARVVIEIFGIFVAVSGVVISYIKMRH